MDIPPNIVAMDLRILFVNDNASSVQPAIDEIITRFAAPETRLVSFNEAQAMIRRFAPHLVVLC